MKVSGDRVKRELYGSCFIKEWTLGDWMVYRGGNPWFKTVLAHYDEAPQIRQGFLHRTPPSLPPSLPPPTFGSEIYLVHRICCASSQLLQLVLPRPHTQFFGIPQYVRRVHVMQILEQLVQAMWKEASLQTSALSTLDVSIEVPSVPFPRLSYDYVLTMLDERDLHIEWGEDFSTEAEKLLGSIMREKGIEFYFITRYPIEAKPFYTMPADDDKYSRSFDLGYRGVEISSGGQRVHQYQLLKERLDFHGLSPENFTFYLNSFRDGLPPRGGFGLGIDRLMMQLLDLPIREVVLFPRDRHRLAP